MTMVFSSLTFIFLFLPITLGIYYAFNLIKDKVIQNRCKNILLLVMSLIFYSFGSLYYLLLLLGSILGNYLFTFFIDKYREKKNLAKTLLIIDLVFNLGLLFYFKYFNLTIDLIESIFQADFKLTDVVLPIGISFFTFQAISYVIDVYLQKVSCQKNPFIVALYISFFPQLIAGPIVQYKDIEQQMNNREESLDKFTEGIRYFLTGLGKKVLIASVLGEVVDTIFNMNSNLYGTTLAWLALICYTMEIYFDFSGYSDMAVGLGKMFGFDFISNFNHPYLATSITDFWRRWHISLGNWFREYVYIPLGGNRKGTARTCFNLFLVFVLTGIWHGANWTFLIWGVIFGILIVIERLGLLTILKKLKVINVILTFLVVMLLWVLFRSDDLSYALAFYGKLFIPQKNIITTVRQSMSIIRWTALGVGLLISFPIPLLVEKFKDKLQNNAIIIAEDVGLMVVFFLSVFFLAAGSYNPFIYFQF